MLNPGSSAAGGQSPRSATPKVHLVIVTHDPGLWFDEMLESVAVQDYPRVEVTVVDNGSEADPTARVHRFLPEAAVHRLDSNQGLGPAVNQVLENDVDQGLLAICHDDVALESNALRLLVEEAIRSNAGIVGPKLVDWDDPTRIRQVGLGVDKTGVLVPSAEKGELDQEQHDAVREVFAVPGGLALVRADLFREIGGFDPEMAYLYEHVDLCWRAQIAGARVFVVPTAIVRHRERLSERQPQRSLDYLDRRHRVRSLLSVYGWQHTLRVVPQAMVLSVLEVLLSLLTGHLAQARCVAAAWGHNLKRPRIIWRRRQAIKRFRQVGDQRIRESQARGYSAATAFLRSTSVAGKEPISVLRSKQSRSFAVAWLVAAVVIFLGVRSLVRDGIPVVGEFVDLGSSGELRSGWWSEFRSVGLGQEGFTSSGLGVLTLLSWLFLGETALLRTVLIVGMIPVGGLGLWRLMRPFDSQWVRWVGLTVYLANPLPYNALANGVWSALLLYGITPWVLQGMVSGARMAPFGSALSAEQRWPKMARDILVLGLLLGLVGAMVPAMPVVLVLIFLGLLLGSVMAGVVGGMGRLLAVAAGGLVIAVVLNLPWSIELISDWRLLFGSRPSIDGGHSWAELLRFDTGPFGHNRLGWALPLAAVLPLALAHDSRLAWAIRGWTLYIGTAAVAFGAEQGWFPVSMPRPEVILVPGAVGLAVAVAMGLAAFQEDVRRYRFGWRQMVPVTALVALAVGVLPMLFGTLAGDWDVPRGDYTEAAPFVESEQAADEQANEVGRVLWLGHPDVLPLGSWPLGDDMAFAVSVGGFPTVAQRWVGKLDDSTRQVADTVMSASDAGINRLGAELAELDIGYILVLERLAPIPYGELAWSVSDRMFTVLNSQLDLVPGGPTTSVVTYRNEAYQQKQASDDSQTANVLYSGDGASVINSLLLAAQIVLWAAALVLLARLSTSSSVARRQARPGRISMMSPFTKPKAGSR